MLLRCCTLFVFIYFSLQLYRREWKKWYHRFMFTLLDDVTQAWVSIKILILWVSRAFKIAKMITPDYESWLIYISMYLSGNNELLKLNRKMNPNVYKYDTILTKSWSRAYLKLFIIFLNLIIFHGFSILLAILFTIPQLSKIPEVTNAKKEIEFAYLPRFKGLFSCMTYYIQEANKCS